jgi:hypothetical protein
VSYVASILPAAIAALVAVTGWYIAHYFTLRREIAAEKRKTQLTFLLEAYRRLEDSGHRSLHKGSEHIAKIESALADIQLLGTADQVKLAQDFMVEFSNSRTGTFDPLLRSLRQTLRYELHLEQVDEKLKFLRITYD